MVLNSSPFIDIIKSFPVVIIANGEFPNFEFALEILQSAEVIICCDGAYEAFLQSNIETQAEIVVTGDGDSLPADLLEKCKSAFISDKSTEYNDLQKALKYCQRKGYKNILLTGCEGKREDHFIANLSIMATYSELLDISMLTAHGIFHVIRQSATLPSFAGQQVSVFCKDSQLPLSFEGLKYPVKERCFQYLWEGSLNEAMGDNFTITMHGDGVVIIYQTLK